MSDYSKTVDFAAKDNLASGQAAKVIKGTEIDTEFNNIATANATKYDSGNLATQAGAEAGTNNTTLMTPLRTEQWSAVWAAENAGIVGDLQAHAATAGDAILIFDQSAAVGDLCPLATNSGLAVSATPDLAVDLDDLVTETTIAAGDFIAMVDITDSGSGKITFANFEGTLNHDNLAGVVADQHVAHSGVSITAGTGMTGGGTIASTRTLNVIGGDGITANANDVALTDYTPTTGRPVGWTSGVPDFDITALADTTIAALNANTFEFVIDDGGTPKAISLQDFGMWVQEAQATQTLAAADANSVMEMNGGVTITIPTNASVAFILGTCFVFVNDHASSACTITASAGVTLNSVYHPGGTDGASDTLTAGGMAVLIKTGTNEWSLSGDITT
jgi:hypothetical protein